MTFLSTINSMEHVFIEFLVQPNCRNTQKVVLKDMYDFTVIQF